MKRPTDKYSKGEIGSVRIVQDFLPFPERLGVLTGDQGGRGAPSPNRL